MKFNLDILKALIYPIVGAMYEVHNELGPGLNEYVYQEGFAMQLEEDGLDYEREKEFIPVYHNRLMNATYRLDFICMQHIIVECKAVEKLTMEHRAQLFNYMRLTKLHAGILVNFAPKSAVIERYFYNPETNEIMNIDGIVLTRYSKRTIKNNNECQWNDNDCQLYDL
jgi:GxxExxY protein